MTAVNDTTRGRLRARYRNVHVGRGTGTETRRLVGAVDGNTVAPAHKHPDAIVLADGWVRWDRKSAVACSCATTVELPTGILVISEKRSPGGRGESEFDAALAVAVRNGGLELDWDAAIHVSCRIVELPDGGEVVEHVVDVRGKRRVYQVAQ